VTDRVRLTFQEFGETVVSRIGLRSYGASLSEATSLSDDLLLDSLGRLELSLEAEELADAEMPVDLLDELRTLGDVYAWYDSAKGGR
jgi:acyl carrier protein